MSLKFINLRLQSNPRGQWVNTWTQRYIHNTVVCYIFCRLSHLLQFHHSVGLCTVPYLYFNSTRARIICTDIHHLNGKVVSMTALVVTGDVEGKPRRWRQASTSTVTTRADTLTTFSILWGARNWPSLFLSMSEYCQYTVLTGIAIWFLSVVSCEHSRICIHWSDNFFFQNVRRVHFAISLHLDSVDI